MEEQEHAARPWLKSYPPGVPAEIDVNAFASLGELFDKSCTDYAERVAYVHMGVGLTYRELERRSRAFAAYLQDVLGLPRGARVALMMPNVLQYPVCMFGILRAGGTVVNCNPLYTPRELAYQLADADATAIVVLENFAHTLDQVLPRTPALRHVLVTGLGDFFPQPKRGMVNFVVRHVKRRVPAWSIPSAVMLNAALARGALGSFTPPDLGHDDIAYLQYTGGTTGVAKGAMLSHGNIIANLQQAHAWIEPFLRNEPQLVITALPLYHIFALTANCLTFFKEGATNVLITDPRDIPGLVRELAKYPFSVITGVNTLFHALLKHPGFARLDFSHLRVSLGGGMAVQAAVAEQWHQVTGVSLVEAYGLTETSPAVTINPLDLAVFNGAIGLPVPSTEVSIRDDCGHALPIGQAGELCVRGPQVMKGYWRRPDETAGAFWSDGFLRTGDVAVMDAQGFVRIVDRKKDMILVSGFNVYPNEVEAVVSLLPGVREVAAVGVPDPDAGEAVKLYVVREDPALTAEVLIAHCRANLTAYKVPHQVEFCTVLPKTTVGKILRRALREPACAQAGCQAA